MVLFPSRCQTNSIQAVTANSQYQYIWWYKNTETIKCEAYPTAYKMQEIVDKEIDDLLKTGVTEHSEAPYASPLVLVQKPDNT